MKFAITTISTCLLLFAIGCGGGDSAKPDAKQAVVASTDQPPVIADSVKSKAIAAKKALFTKLSGRLMEVMKSEGPAKAIAVCSKEAGPMAVDVGREQGVRIGRTSLKLRNPVNTIPEWAGKLATETATEPQFIEVDEATVGALLPIKLQEKCLTCHGPADTIAENVRDQLATLYPEDTATGFNEGDLRGWFWVEVPKNTAETVASDQLIQFGQMHEVIGMQKHHGRVVLKDITSKPGLFAVGAIEGLQGEITIADSEVIATTINDDAELMPFDVDSATQATLLVGDRVTDWFEHKVEQTVPAEKYDEFLTQLAASYGIDTTKPFVLTAEGSFIDLRLHVIHGACPVHAERNGIELPPETRPYKGQYDTLSGSVVGVFAKDAAGVLTHPGFSTHTHVVFAAADGERQTGHVESIGLAAGTIIRLPAKRATKKHL